MTTTPYIYFFVPGEPVPKQSFRVLKSGHGYTDPRVKAWQAEIGIMANIGMIGIFEPLTCGLDVQLDFYLGNNRRVDLDNLSKAVLDACNHIIWEDDRQIQRLTLVKNVFPDSPGVLVSVWRHEDALPH